MALNESGSPKTTFVTTALNQDELIVHKIHLGDEEGIRDLLNLYGSQVLDILRTRFGGILSGTDLEEALSRATFKVWQSAHRTFDPSRGSLRSWFLVIANNAALDMYRAQRNARHHSLEDVGYELPAKPEHQEPDWMEVLREAVEALPHLERLVLRADMEAGGRADSDKLAETLGTTRSSVYSSRAAAKKKLQAALRRCGYEFDESTNAIMHVSE